MAHQVHFMNILKKRTILGVDKMSASLEFRYTTGPISGSQFQDNIRILVLNNGSKKHTAQVKIYNLDTPTKTKVYDETFTIASKSQIGTGYIPSFEAFEVQVLTDSSMVYSWVGNRAGTENLPGNTVLSKEMIRF